MSLQIVILAAGLGTRMKSDRPKVLHTLGGRPLLAHVLETAESLRPGRICVVYGHGGEQLREQFDDPRLSWALQEAQLGTGHAVQQALPELNETDPVLVLYGDVPLIRADTLAGLVAALDDKSIALLTARLADPNGYGRIVRDAEGDVTAIVEQKDASPAQLAIDEINTGILALPAGRLSGWLERLNNDNAQGEYYLTDLVSMAVADGLHVKTCHPAHDWEILGVNSQRQLAELERIHQRHCAEALADAGVCFADLDRVDIRGTLNAGRDVRIDVNAVFEGTVELADGVEIGPGCVIRNARIGPGAKIDAFSHIDGAEVGAGASVGPYARLRPGTRLADGSKAGNFVEVKNATIGPGSKVNHLSYIGDAELGRDVNVGAGTITCNYDGANKHKTEIGDDAFIGSNTALVAPVKVGKGANIGAGSTINKDAPEGKLTLTRSPQRTIDGWQRPTKQNKDKE